MPRRRTAGAAAAAVPRSGRAVTIGTRRSGRAGERTRGGGLRGGLGRLRGGALGRCGLELDVEAEPPRGVRVVRHPLEQVLVEGLGLLGADGDADAALAALEAKDPVLAMLVEPMLGVTLAPTRISASEKINVIPARAIRAAIEKSSQVIK